MVAAFIQGPFPPGSDEHQSLVLAQSPTAPGPRRRVQLQSRAPAVAAVAAARQRSSLAARAVLPPPSLPRIARSTLNVESNRVC